MGLERGPGSSVSLIDGVSKVDEISKRGSLTIEPRSSRGTDCPFVYLFGGWWERGSYLYLADGRGP